MGSPHRARLARRLAMVTEAARHRVSERQRLRDNAAASARIRAALAEADIDPLLDWYAWSLAAKTPAGPDVRQA